MGTALATRLAISLLRTRGAGLLVACLSMRRPADTPPLPAVVPGVDAPPLPAVVPIAGLAPAPSPVDEPPADVCNVQIQWPDQPLCTGTMLLALWHPNL